MTNPEKSPASLAPTAPRGGVNPGRRGVRTPPLAVLGTILLAGALAALMSGGQDVAGARPSGTLRLIVELNRSADARDDLEPAGDSPGDQVTSADPVFDSANRTRIGRAMFLSTFEEDSYQASS